VISNIDFLWTPKFSTYIQGEFHGTNEDVNNTGYVAMVGGRLVF